MRFSLFSMATKCILRILALTSRLVNFYEGMRYKYVDKLIKRFMKTEEFD